MPAAAAVSYGKLCVKVRWRAASPIPWCTELVAPWSLASSRDEASEMRPSRAMLHVVVWPLCCRVEVWGDVEGSLLYPWLSAVSDTTQLRGTLETQGALHP